MEVPVSPLFPASSLAGVSDDAEYLLPQLPDAPLVLSSSIQVYIVPTEKHLFVQGFKPSEFEGLPPTLLRGCLVVRVLKPTKIRSISLQFRGIQRTDWPEGIPPKKNLYAEANDVISHTWPFFHMETPTPNCGANLYIPPRNDDVTHLALDHTVGMPLLVPMDLAASFAASLIKRATSPLAGALSSTHSLAPTDSMADLTAVLSSLSISTMGDSLKPGYFAAGEYVYNFEHPLPALSPETTSVNFGRVTYYLECTVTRVGAFKPNLSGRLPMDVVRVPCDNSVEENEPIVIERDWEDQLKYEIVVGSKSVVLDLYVPLVFRFIPLYGKVALHRIRVYLTETCNYYCNNKSVHREEPMKKFLLLEHKAKKNKSLLLKSGGMTDAVIENDEVLPRELEFQMFVPSMINKKYNYCIHPDTSFENIKCEHWIKILLRISKQDPNIPDKRKHFEILIDLPIHLCLPLAAHCNTLLPAYDMEPEFLPKYSAASPPMSPDVTPIDYLHHGHLILLALNIGGTNAKSPLQPPLRPATPIEFHHIIGTSNNDEPIERDLDVHLEANLYQPLEPETFETLGTPQARPFSPVASPTMRPLTSPTVRPQSPTMWLLTVPEPSLQPPLFEDVGAAAQTLPPAYLRDPTMSLSPLRLDSPTRKKKDTGIKGMLNKQLDRRSESSGSSVGTSKKSIDGRVSMDSRERKKKAEEERGIAVTGQKPKATGATKTEATATTATTANGTTPAKGKTTINGTTTANGTNAANGTAAKAIATTPTTAPSNATTTGTAESEGTELESTMHVAGNVETIISRDSPSPNMDIPHSTVMASAISGLQTNRSVCSDDFDIADMPFDLGSRLRVDNMLGISRKSSMSLATLDDPPLDQTLPLLSLSSSSVDEPQFDFAHRHGSTGSTADLVDAAQFGHYHNISGSLFTLRNPRIKKHYQENTDVEPPAKPRQKSFGVIPMLNRTLTGSSDGSEMTVAIASSNSSKADAYMEPVDLQEVASK